MKFKKYLLILVSLFILLIFSSCNKAYMASFLKGVNKGLQQHKYNRNYVIKNQWFKARVEYSNFSSGTFKTYVLNVKVKRDRAIMISFPNGGNVHTGINFSGYIYRGGYLNFTKNYNGKIEEASTSVVLYYNNGNTVKFNILIN
ncbi:MAG: hypothetical protein FXF54_00250 [Kosmotoga sp.]|nr:MAG: hypothetical protein FXF54_00250 [Kosmotoga sp.]